MKSKEEQKQDFIKELAHFLVDNAAGKGILLEMESMRGENNPIPFMAKEWAKLRNASPIWGYTEYDEAVEVLTEFLA